MKHIVLIIMFLPVSLFAQTKNDSVISRTDSLLQALSDQVEDIQFRLHGLNRYKIYQLENIYNVLKLDTMTGKIDLVQWSLKADEEMTVHLNTRDLSYGDGYCGMFELYPTKNMYQFILLNKLTGDTWHVQWGTESSKRWIRKIY